MQSNTQFAAEQLAGKAEEAAHALKLAQFTAARAKLLAGSYAVGPDAYTSDFFVRDKRPAAELEYQPGWRHSYSHESASSLHRLPNGDWLEIIGYGMSWTRHTYDLAYALDRARRAAIGGYVVRADLAAVMLDIVSVGANRMGIYAMWQELPRNRDHECAYSHEGNLYATEKSASWIKCLTEDGLRLHPRHAELIQRAIDLLGEPDVLRVFPASLNVSLSAITRELEEALASEVSP